jgi:flagellar biosynthesis/type III secretory pathway protein FliH
MDSHWLDTNQAPTADAYGATPYDASEIDQHVDGARIWATILQIREEVEAKTDKAFARGRSCGREEAKEDQEELFDDYRQELQEAFDELKNGFTKAAMQRLQEVINEANQ